MYCTKCGKQLFDEAVMCPGCGAPTSNYVQSPAKKEEETYEVSYKAVCVEKELTGRERIISGSDIRYVDVLFGRDTLTLKLRDTAGKMLLKTLSVKYNDITADLKKGQFTILVLKAPNFVISLFAFRSDKLSNKLAVALADENNYDVRSDKSIYSVIEEIRKYKKIRR